MKALLFAMKWDLIRQQRYYIIAAAVFVTMVYVAIFQFLPIGQQTAIIITLIFNDPTSLGLLFIGSVYLFEKSENTLQAMAVTPMTGGHYLLSKTITLTGLATVSSLVMAFAAVGLKFQPFYFISGIALSASLFTLLGFILVTRCKSFNEYIGKMALVMLPAAFPFLQLFGLIDTVWIYVIPVQAGIVLLEAAFTTASIGDIVYGYSYLLLANAATFIWALKAYRRVISG